MRRCGARIAQCSCPPSLPPRIHPIGAMAEHTDAFGFTLKLTELQVAERKECDIVSERDAPSWTSIVAGGKWPSDARLKDMIRKVRSRDGSSIWAKSFGSCSTALPS